MLAEIVQRLTPARPQPVAPISAAVAVLLTPHVTSVQALLMVRAERTGDPWSGHVALPGGRHEAHDADLLATALRETHEELGIDLAPARYLGHLPEVSPRYSGPKGMAVMPFVFWHEQPPAITLSVEATAAFWLPLGAALRGELDGHIDYPALGHSRLPAWHYQGRVIWGLTWRILGMLGGLPSPFA